MALEFTKMHGLGNDFVVLDGVSRELEVDASIAQRLANRRFGVGCDQVLLVQRPATDDADFRFRIFNADGSEVEHCGNGLRCVARFVREKALSTAQTLTIDSLQSRSVVRLEDGDQVCVDMGAPELEPARVPFHAEHRDAHYWLDVGSEMLDVGVVALGNPHTVMSVRNVDTAPVHELGPSLERHTAFPQRVNVGFMQILDAGRIRLRVYERGAGETLACGTGACAAVVIGQLWGLLGMRVVVELPGGELVIHSEGEGTAVWMTGPATSVFEGCFLGIGMNWEKPG